MTWPFSTRKVDPELIERKRIVEKELAKNQSRMNQSIQTIQSASRVMHNMAGLMVLLNRSYIRDDR